MNRIIDELKSAARGDHFDDLPWWWDVPHKGGPSCLLEDAADEIQRLTDKVENLEMENVALEDDKSDLQMEVESLDSELRNSEERYWDEISQLEEKVFELEEQLL